MIFLIFAPVFLYLLIFAFYPAFGMLFSSFVDNGHVSLINYTQTLQGQYLSAFEQTSLLSFEGGLIGVVGGGLVTFALVRTRSKSVQRFTTALASIMANFAGLPLAVSFMATLGTSGFVTVLISRFFGINITNLGWNLASLNGLVVVYVTFLVPLAVVLLLPAFQSIRVEWEEAVYTLGGSVFRYLRSVVIPILFPGIVGTFALLFANAFSSYVTAYAIAGGRKHGFGSG